MTLLSTSQCVLECDEKEVYSKDFVSTSATNSVPRIAIKKHVVARVFLVAVVFEVVVSLGYIVVGVSVVLVFVSDLEGIVYRRWCDCLYVCRTRSFLTKG